MDKPDSSKSVDRQQNEPRTFVAGTFVKLRDGLSARTLRSFNRIIKRGEVYRILDITSPEDGGGALLWLGPHDLPEQDIKDFLPELAGEYRYEKVIPVSYKHLRVAPH